METEAEIFKKNAKTFSYAGKFFDSQTQKQIETMYSFFRFIDDLAERQDQAGRDLMRATINEWHSCSKSNPQLARAQRLFDELQIDRSVIDEFLRCMSSDIQGLRIKTDEELLRYCYGAASTVGLCLVEVFRVREPLAHSHAIDLGIAMQLTNIVRDIVEDHSNDKIYLPELSERDLCEISDDELKQIKAKYVALAEKYYTSASSGFKFLPWRIRFCVSLAAHLYRRIGILSLRPEFLRKRAYTRPPEKALRLVLHFLTFSLSSFAPQTSRRHDSLLHRNLQGLPYVQPSF